MTGFVHSFESMAAVDGDGLRCAVFLAGCPMRCVYCHNPDTWHTEGGRQTEAEALVKKIARYKPYFGKDGGVTFSGGEPLAQAEFLRSMMPLLAEQGIRYAVDTAGGVPLTETVKEVLSGAQEVLLDLKFPDDAGYRRYTGVGIDRPLAILDFLNAIGKKTRVRTVIVPDLNDTEEALLSYLAHLADKSCVDRYELLAFHTMGFFKYEKLGIANPLAEKKALDPAVKQRLQAFVDEKMKENR